RPGTEYLCTHEHHDCGDECLSVRISAELLETLAGDERRWRGGRLPPVPRLAVLGELAQAAAEGKSDVGADEAGMLFAAAYVSAGTSPAHCAASARERRRAVTAALWLGGEGAGAGGVGS